MPSRSAADPAAAVAAVAVFLVVLAVHFVLARRAVADLGREDVRARSGSKGAWFVVIVLAAIIGPLGWFWFGREPVE
jgi:hypothetical protein